MIIDFHTHTFPDAMAEKTVALLKQKSGTVPFSDGTVGGLSFRAAKAGVELSIVLPVITNPASTQKINRFAAAQNESAEKTGVFSFGGMHPDTPDVKGAIKEIRNLGLKGFKIHPAYQRTQINDIKYKRIIGYAEEEGLIVVSHGGLDIGVDGSWCSPQAAAELIADVKPERFVLAHMGGWEQWRDVKTHLCGRKVYFDTSFCAVDFAYQNDFPAERQKPVMTREEFTEIVKLHGADRILFGTDSPWGDEKTQIDFINGLNLSPAEKSEIFFENAKKLLGNI
ncbi:MAG: amidohydrolase family protein [Clostridia bacterium]|nr:amidohydrolase family protein [Clostridia bacterium]